MGLQVCEIEVAHKSASRVHACIAFDESQQPFLVDLGSTHGKASNLCCFKDHQTSAHAAHVGLHRMLILGLLLTGASRMVCVGTSTTLGRLSSKEHILDRQS